MTEKLTFAFYEEVVSGRRIAVVQDEWEAMKTGPKASDLVRAMANVVGQIEARYPVRHLRELDCLKLGGDDVSRPPLDHVYACSFGEVGVVFAAEVGLIQHPTGVPTQRLTGILVLRICELVSGQLSVRDQRLAVERLSAVRYGEFK